MDGFLACGGEEASASKFCYGTKFSPNILVGRLSECGVHATANRSRQRQEEGPNPPPVIGLAAPLHQVAQWCNNGTSIT